MTDKTPVSNKGFSADWFVQGALAKIGDTLDRFTGRRWTPSSSLATSELVERMKKLLDSEAKDVAGKGFVVPHNISLKVQWDKFSTDADDSLEKLESELLTAAVDHINDKLYYTYAPLRLEVKPDYFTEGVRLFVSFDKFSDDESEAQLNVTIPSISLMPSVPTEIPSTPVGGDVFIAQFELDGSRRDRRLKFPANGRLSVGRTAANELMINDISVSKIHASLAVDDDANLSVADTGSTNGTFVNDERIAYGKAVSLNEGDRLKFGTVEVVFEHVPLDPTVVPETISVENAFQIDGIEFTSKVSTELPEKTLEISPQIEKSLSDLTEEPK